jgi:hypothetical protein
MHMIAEEIEIPCETWQQSQNHPLCLASDEIQKQLHPSPQKENSQAQEPTYWSFIELSSTTARAMILTLEAGSSLVALLLFFPFILKFCTGKGYKS